VSEHQRWLEEHKTFANIRMLRDKVLAHTDMQSITQPYRPNDTEVDMKEAEICFKEILLVTNFYFNLYNGGEFVPTIVNEFITRDFAHARSMKDFCLGPPPIDVKII
jgi:hypothetical protein